MIAAETKSKCNYQSPCFCAGDICIAGGDCKSGNAYVDRKPICDNEWDRTNADVFCKTIGYPGVNRPKINSR